MFSALGRGYRLPHTHREQGKEAKAVGIFSSYGPNMKASDKSINFAPLAPGAVNCARY